MDIWKWVHERSQTLYDDGHRDLAYMIEDISHFAVNDDLQKVDEIYNQALPLCRAMGDKWLEVYFRHWRLQAHVLKNYDAKGLLPECISLLDFSHAPETKDCPQRVCAVQDLAACYGIKDGPGYAEERIQVCKETLAEIDGSWPCYQCVGAELLDAYMDAKRYDDVDAELKAMDLEMRRHNETLDTEFQLTRTNYYYEIGDLEKAWSIAKDAVRPGGGTGFVRSRDLSKALILCAQEKWDEARTTCPSYEDVLVASTYFRKWSLVQLKLVEAGQVENDRRLRFRLHNLAQKLEDKGAYRVAFEVYEYLAELCLRASETVRGTLAVAAMDKVRSEFNRDMGAAEKAAEFRDRLDKLPAADPAQTFATAKDVIEHDFSDETAEYRAVDAALETWATDPDLISRKVELLENLFQPDAAYDFLQATYDDHPNVAALEFEFGRAYLRKHGFAAFQKAFPMEELEGLEKAKIWNRGFLHVRELEQHDPEAALNVLKTIEPHWQGDLYLYSQIANLLIRLGRYEDVLSYRAKQREIDPDNTNVKWDFLIAATLCDATDKIVEISTDIGMSVDENGLYAEDQQPTVRLERRDDSGALVTVFARRIGPALARVTTVSDINAATQVFGQEIVFDPAPLNQLDQEDEQGHPCDKDGYYSYLYPAVATRRAPAYRTFAIDGVSPGKKVLAQLAKTIEDAGFIYNRRSTEEYRLVWEDENGDQSGNGIYIYVLAEAGRDLNALDKILKELNAEIEHPLVWLRLSEALGDEEMLKRQVEIAETYGLED